MRRELHVRFCEGGGVRFPSATRLVICCRARADEALVAMRKHDVEAEVDGERK